MNISRRIFIPHMISPLIQRYHTRSLKLSSIRPKLNNNEQLTQDQKKKQSIVPADQRSYRPRYVNIWTSILSIVIGFSLWYAFVKPSIVKS